MSELTHSDPDAGDACVLWCLAIRHAVLTGVLDVRIGLRHIDADRGGKWSSLLDTAENSRPAHFRNNGWVVEALQGAWSAITTTPIPQDDPGKGVFRADRLRLALDAAVRGGGDTDTVAAIAGGLLGGVYGASAVPAQWRHVLHGWPGLSTRGLVALATRIMKADKPYSYHVEPMTPVRHPHDDEVWLGNVAALQTLPSDVDAMVSLCRVHDDDLAAGVEQIDVRLIDDVGSDDNANLDFVLIDTTSLIEQLRLEGRTVLLHCVAAQSRTPTVAALYGARLCNISADEALREIAAVLPQASRTPCSAQHCNASQQDPTSAFQQRDRAAASPHQNGRPPMTKNYDDGFPYEQACSGCATRRSWPTRWSPRVTSWPMRRNRVTGRLRCTSLHAGPHRHLRQHLR